MLSQCTNSTHTKKFSFICNYTITLVNMHGNKQYLIIIANIQSINDFQFHINDNFCVMFCPNILATPCNSGTYYIWICSFFKRACSFIQRNLFSTFWSQYLFTIIHKSVRKAKTGEFSMAHSLATAFVCAYVIRTYN